MNGIERVLDWIYDRFSKGWDTPEDEERFDILFLFLCAMVSGVFIAGLANILLWLIEGR